MSMVELEIHRFLFSKRHARVGGAREQRAGAFIVNEMDRCKDSALNSAHHIRRAIAGLRK